MALTYIISTLCSKTLGIKLRSEFTQEEEANWRELEGYKVTLFSEIEDLVCENRISYVVARDLIASKATTHTQKLQAANILFENAGDELSTKINLFILSINDLKEK